MRLQRRIAFSLALLATFACSDSTSPVVARAVYVLESVDGHPLPTVLSSGPIETITVLDGSLTLFSNDSASEAIRSVDSMPQFGVSRDTAVFAGEYRLAGDSIQVGFFGACRDICRPNRIGLHDDSTVTLTNEALAPSAPVYRYKRVASASQ